MKKPFVPKMLPIDLPNEHIIELLNLEINARVKVQHFNSLMERSVIKEELLIIFSIDESLQSTRLEGTQASYSDVAEAELTGVASDDVQEVLNYLNALKLGEDLLKTLPLCTRVFLRLHEEILNNSRGGNRAPGEYRKIQNFIGPTQKIEDATYIPPEPHLVKELINNLEEYMNDDTLDQFGYLVRAGIIHGQFETIHPFLDGNGRFGRILIILYLYNKNVIHVTNFFISGELERNKYKYYSLLNRLREKNPKWKEWLVFFLQSTEKQACYYIDKLTQIESLYNRMYDFAIENKINHKLIKYLFIKPIVTVSAVSKAIGVSDNTARSYLKKLVNASFLYTNDKKRYKTYICYEIMDIVR